MMNITSTKQQAAQKEKKHAEAVQFTTFRLADELFGVNALRVQEILMPQELTDVPLAPEYVKGLINLRGQIVTVIDLRRRLGFEQAQNGTEGMNLVVYSEEGPMSLRVDHIGNVLDIPANKLLPPPGTIRGVAAHYIDAVCQLEDALLIVLDLNSILRLV